MDNIFFDIETLKHVGKNVIIGKTVRIRYPELVSIGDNCIIDDFTYISTPLELKKYVHISSGAKIIGGKNSYVFMDEFSTTAPNVVLSAGSDDYAEGIATPLVPSRKIKERNKQNIVTKSGGDARRCTSIDKAVRLMNFKPSVTVEIALKKRLTGISCSQN